MGLRWRALTIAAAGAAAVPLALAAASSGSCSLAELYDGAPDAGPDGRGGAAASSSVSTGGTDGGAADADAADSPSCPGDMVRITSGTTVFCVDRLEVSNADYAVFLDASAPGAPPDACAWNTSYAPAVALDAGPDLPVLGVDWCDAYAYCAWAGKHLCGTVGGGALAPDKRDTTGDAWWEACTHKGDKHYPYGDAFSITACADCNPDAGCDPDASPPTSQPAKVGTKHACEGGYTGLFDMSGNAWEWQDACDDTGVLPDASPDGGHVPDPRYDTCYRRGGSYLLPHGSDTADTCLVCSSSACKIAGDLRMHRARDVGLRCCLDP